MPATQTGFRRLSITLLAVLTLALGACASGVKLDDVDESGKGGSGSGNYSKQPWNDPSSPLYNKSVYFDLDSYTVKSSDQATLSAHASYLKSNKEQKIIIQGNTDDLGTTEYNLALGQKRSEAVRKVLSLLGVSESQMEAVSFGKEKPKASGTDDASRSENRRADIVY
jgi:peptidoglycan-associated lipoprotein